MGKGKIAQYRLCEQEGGRDKLKQVLISQRVDAHRAAGERRDALDQRWVAFLNETDAIPIPVPNSIGVAMKMLKTIPFDGIILSGGNSPARYGGDAPERDETDAYLIEYAMECSTPLIGICRGLQSIVLQFGGTLESIDGHVATRHHLHGSVNRTVNSYHSLTVGSVPPCIKVLARSEDGSVEMLKHVSMPIIGLMWHPEREVEFASEDISLFANLWAGNAVEP